MVEKLVVGMVLDEEVEDSIDPITLHKENVRYEKVLVEDITKFYVKLYNFDRQKTRIIDNKFMDLYLRKGLYRITNERA